MLNPGPQKNVQAEQLEAILNQLNNKLISEPNNAKYMVDKARILTFLRRNDEALEVITRACAVDPNSKEAWRLRGDILSNLGRSEAARIAYQRSEGLANMPQQYVQRPSSIIYICPTCGGTVPENANRCPQCGLPIVNSRSELPPGTVGILRSALKKIDKRNDAPSGEVKAKPSFMKDVRETGSIEAIMIEDSQFRKISSNSYGVQYLTDYGWYTWFAPLAAGAAIAAIMVIIKVIM